MDGSRHWLTPQLSLLKEAKRELDRRNAVKLSHHELQMVADKLIVDWYTHRELVNRLLAKVQELEVRLVLADANPSDADNWREYLEMAEELLGGNPS
jgi:hypothetical protein